MTITWTRAQLYCVSKNPPNVLKQHNDAYNVHDVLVYDVVILILPKKLNYHMYVDSSKIL